MNFIDNNKIYDSRNQAYLDLLVTPVKKDDVIIRKYYTSSGIDVFTAIVTKDCAGYPDSLDYIKIIDEKSLVPVYSIVESIPDVSNLVEGEILLYVNWKDEDKIECNTYLVYLENGIKQIKPFSLNLTEIVDISTGERYIASFNSFKSSLSFMSDKETESKINTKAAELNNTIETSINSLKDNEIAELMREVFPLSITVNSVSPKVCEIGTTQEITLKYSVSRKGEEINSDCINTLYGNDVVLDIDPTETSPLTYKTSISETTKFKLNSVYNLISGYSETTPGDTVSFVNKSYYGVASSDSDKDTIYSTLHPELRTKSTLTWSGINLTLSDTIFYYYPKSYGTLVSIKDSNGFDYINDYTRQEIKIEEVEYYLYTKNTPTEITGFKQIFSF